MIACPHPASRPILVAASETSDAALARSAVEELGLIPVLVQDAAEAIRHLSGDRKRYAAAVVGERIGQATGFTFCGVARDAGCRLPMLLLTSDICRWTAVRAARLQVSVLWQPVPASRLAKTLSVMLPPPPASSEVALPVGAANSRPAGRGNPRTGLVPGACGSAFRQGSASRGAPGTEDGPGAA